jgi:outer membrane protein assembly factor BamA
VGTLQFTQATADFRRYQFLRPMTLALRGLHFGRYGRDEAQLSPIFLGYSSLMRGYSYGSVVDACEKDLGQVDQTNPAPPESCLLIDQLRGSRIGVVNAELRVPLIRPTGGSVGIPPVEGIAFFDAGAAWGKVLVRDAGQVIQTEQTDLVFRRGIQDDPNERGIMTSMGVGGRVNLFGFFVLEAVYVNAMERPRGWHWEFALQPGF